MELILIVAAVAAVVFVLLKFKKTTPVAAPPQAVPVPTPAPPASVPPAPPAPVRLWSGWNPEALFESWDLNPLAQQTGLSRDVLAQTRDVYLNGLVDGYQRAIGRQVDANTLNVWRSESFRRWVRTGQIPTD